MQSLVFAFVLVWSGLASRQQWGVGAWEHHAHPQPTISHPLLKGATRHQRLINGAPQVTGVAVSGPLPEPARPMRFAMLSVSDRRMQPQIFRRIGRGVRRLVRRIGGIPVVRRGIDIVTGRTRRRRPRVGVIRSH